MNVTKILKYPVETNGGITSITCRNYRLLDIQFQGDNLVCWIETRDDVPETTTELVSIGTGWEIPSYIMNNTKYLKTIQDAAGFVWHFYELLSGH